MGLNEINHGFKIKFDNKNISKIIKKCCFFFAVVNKNYLGKQCNISKEWRNVTVT